GDSVVPAEVALDPTRIGPAHTSKNNCPRLFQPQVALAAMLWPEGGNEDKSMLSPREPASPNRAARLYQSSGGPLRFGPPSSAHHESSSDKRLSPPGPTRHRKEDEPAWYRPFGRAPGHGRP